MSASSPIGFAIIGTGTIARLHARALAATPGTALRAVHSRSLERARAFAAEFACDAHDDLAALLARPDVAAVLIATPSGAHGEAVLAALRAGKHVLCEKPLEITTARIDAMIAAADAAQHHLAAIFQNRFSPAAQRLKRAVEAGRFGRLALCSAYVKWWRDPSYYSTSNWKGTAALDGGGALMNQGIHAVDLLQWLAGAPHTVSALVRTRAHTIEAEDTVAAHLDFPSGAVGVIEAATSCYPGTPLRIELSGDRGTAILETDKIVKWDFAEKHPDDDLAPEPAVSLGSGASDPKAINLEGHKLLIADLARAITTGTAPAISAREARTSVAIIQAIYESSRQRRPFAVE